MQVERWIEAAQQGSEIACELLYRHYVGPLYRLAYGVLLNKEDAEEVVQDSFAYAFRTLKRFDPEKSAFKTWLYTITMSRCRNKRRRKVLPTVDLESVRDWLPSGAKGPEHIAIERSTRQVVLNALNRLTAKQREAIVLRYFEGLTYREMAEVLACNQKTVESRVRLAHESLYNLLADTLPEGILSFE